MADESSNRGVIVVLASSLGVALLVIAFLLGRLWNQDEHAGSPPAVPELEPPSSAAEAKPLAASPTTPGPEEAAPVFQPVDPRQASVVRIDRRPDGRIVLSNTESAEPAEPSERSAVPKQAPMPDTTDAVREYLLQVDRIQSTEGADDPNAFAMQLIKAGLGGASSGFDRLIDDTKRMETEMKSLTPPPSCQRYHEASLQGVVESRKMLEDLKAAITKRDIAQLTTIAREAGRLQEQADAIKAMEKEIRAGL
jgi:hypothetical protein